MKRSMPDFKRAYHDEYTREQLPQELVKEAVLIEMG